MYATHRASSIKVCPVLLAGMPCAARPVRNWTLGRKREGILERSLMQCWGGVRGGVGPTVTAYRSRLKSHPLPRTFKGELLAGCYITPPRPFCLKLLVPLSRDWGQRVKGESALFLLVSVPYMVQGDRFTLTSESSLVTIRTTRLNVTQHFAHRRQACDSHSKYRLFPWTALTDWLL